MAYILQLELNLKHATERIRCLEKEARSLRVESMVAEGSMLSQTLMDPAMMGIYSD
jgi:hypothetical protein